MGRIWITASTTLLESQTNLESGLPVVVDGSGVVLTLSNSATYGNLPIYRFGNLIVTNGASVVGLSQGSMSPYTITNRGVAIQVSGDLIIASNCSINADGTGFPGGIGPGYSAGGGGTHGGLAVNTTKPTYGSATNPVCLGSGSGWHNVAGGGAIKLIVNGNLVVNGRLSANGVPDGNAAGGAGGSIWIAGSGMLGGTGEVQVSGGADIISTVAAAAADDWPLTGRSITTSWATSGAQTETQVVTVRQAPSILARRSARI
jgi:hypothetical protein